MRKVSPGVYETTRPIPLSGSWKTLIRLHKGNALLGLPVYAPADAAIPVAAVPAPAPGSFDRSFLADKKLLQREQKGGLSDSLWTIAYAIVGLCVLLLLIILTWALARSGRIESAAPAPPKESSGGARVAPGRVATGSAS